MTAGVLSSTIRVLALTIVCSASVVPRLWADPVTVTSGTFRLEWGEDTLWAFHGTDGFALIGVGPIQVTVNPQFLVSFATPGTAVNLSAVAGDGFPYPVPLPPFGLGVGIGNINGTEYSSKVALAGTFRFDAPTIVLPTPQSRELRVDVPFAFNGQVTGFAVTNLNAPVPLFHVDLVGQGTADLFADYEKGLFTVPDVTYTFAATPEPATVGLLGLGLIGVVGRARQRMRGSRRQD